MSTTTQDLLRELIEDNPGATMHEIRRLYIDAVRNDSQIVEAAIGRSFVKDWADTARVRTQKTPEQRAAERKATAAEAKAAVEQFKQKVIADYEKKRRA